VSLRPQDFDDLDETARILKFSFNSFIKFSDEWRPLVNYIQEVAKQCYESGLMDGKREAEKK